MSTALSAPPFLRPDVSWDAVSLAMRGTWHRALPDPVADEFQLYVALRPQLHTANFRWYPSRLPRVAALGHSLRMQLVAGDGFCWLHGLDELDLSPEHQRCLQLALGCAIGEPMPVAATPPPAAGRFRTAGAATANAPDVLGLLRQQSTDHERAGERDGGGDTAISNALRAHELLAREAPDALALLERPWHHDAGTSDAAPSAATTMRQRFPVFARGQTACDLRLRYLRGALENGALRNGARLDAAAQRALDLLDAALARPEHVVRFTLEPGDMLWLDNRVLAHDLAADRDDAAGSGCQRLWLQARRRPALLR